MAADMEPKPNQHDDDRQSDLAVMDVDEYKQKRRLERILSDIDSISDNSRKAWAQYVNGTIDLNALRITVQRNVKEAIWECRYMLERHAEAVIEADDDRERDEYWLGDPANPIGVIEQHQRDDERVNGLQDYLFLDEMWTESWSEIEKRRNMPAREEEKVIHHTVPVKISREAAYRLHKFLSEERGIELRAEREEGRREARFDYSDILENGPPDKPRQEEVSSD